MALSLLALLSAAVLLCVLTSAQIPQCASSCLSDLPPECAGAGGSGRHLPCSSGGARAVALPIPAHDESTPSELGSAHDVLHACCRSSQGQGTSSVDRPKDDLLPLGTSTNPYLTRRDDDDDDDDDGDGDSSRHSNVGAAVGGTIGGIAAVAVLAAIYIHHRRRRQRRPRQPKKRRRAEIDPEEDAHNQFRPPQIFQPASGNYDPVAQHDASAPPLVPTKDAAEDDAGAVRPPAYDHPGGSPAGTKPS